MSDSEAIVNWVVLHAVPGMGPVIFRRILDRFGSAGAVLEAAGRDELESVRGVTRVLAASILRARGRMEWGERTVERLREGGVRILRMSDEGYPSALHDLPNPPPLLYVLGEFTSRDARAVGMVGTTKPSDRGRRIAEGFAARLASAGVTVVSGYAHGIDAASHRGAFRGGGRSILCVPYGIGHFRARPDFPPLREIAERGAVVSECPPDAEWSSRAAVARNRIIAALGRALLVVETRTRGGTLHTVRASQDLRRPVFALKYRQPPDSARGNSVLIARGATAMAAFGEINKILEALD